MRKRESVFRGKTRSTKANRHEGDKHPHRARKRETMHRGKTRQNRNRARHFRNRARHFRIGARHLAARSGQETASPFSGQRHDARARRVRWARHFASLKLGGSELRRVTPLARRLRPAAVGAVGKRPSLKRGGCELRRTRPWAGNLDSRHFAPDPAPSLPEDKSSQQQCSEVRS